MEIRVQHLRRDALTACGLALVLGLVWTVRDWSALSTLRLPDTDDGMRLQQIRDWLAGQAFRDLTQYRLGAGVPMHWSRLPDLVPGGSIALLTPLVGRPVAEVSTVIAWPIMLFAVALCLVARIARMLGGGTIAPTASVIAAIAYPATTIFLPGRIDHHGLQVVLLLGATLASLGTATVARGIIIGALAAATLAVGLETVPLFVVLGVVLLGEWVVRGVRARLIGLSIGALVGLTVAFAIFAPQIWHYPACDGFTAQTWAAATIASVAPALLALTSRLWTTAAARALASLGVCGGLATVAVTVAPGCASPYGAVDPMLARLWLSQVGEAQSILSAPIATVVGYCGVMIVGWVATLSRAAAVRSWGWIVVAALQIGAIAITLVQLRGAYAGTMLAAPGLAAMIAGARDRGSLRLATAWLASAGMLYPIAANAVLPSPAEPDDQSACATPPVIAALATLPAGTVMAPIDVGGYGIPATAHRFVAAPYHRNGPGNLAMFAFYHKPPGVAARTLAAWHVDYVLACPGMPGSAIRGSTADRLQSGALPGLVALARPAPHVVLFAVRR